MLPPPVVIANAHCELVLRWRKSEAAPSLEVFREAIVRANEIGGYTSPSFVVARILEGVWP